MSVQRQTTASNAKRSESYKKTASRVKLNGHKNEQIFVAHYGGQVIKTGQKHTLLDAKGNQVEVKTKTDVKHPIYGNVSIKAPTKWKVQMQLQVTEEVEKKWGSTNPLYLASKAQREFYEDRHFNTLKNTSALHKIACDKVKDFATWLNDPINFRAVLEYALTNDGEISYIADMCNTGVNAYMTPAKDFIDEIINANPQAYVTPSGLRVAVKIFIGEFNKQGKKKTRTAFSFEVRSDKDKCNSLLYKMEGKVIFSLIRKTPKCIKLESTSIQVA